MKPSAWSTGRACGISSFCRAAPCAANTAITPETWAFTKDTASTPQEAFAAAYRYRNYWRGNGGLTISGGEPLLQLDFVSEVFRLARAKKVQTALDTSAQPFAPDNAEWMARFDRLLENTDLVILDLKEIDDEKHKKLTGHSNKNNSGHWRSMWRPGAVDRPGSAMCWSPA